MLTEKADDLLYVVQVFGKRGEGCPELGVLHMDNHPVFLTGYVKGDLIGLQQLCLPVRLFAELVGQGGFLSVRCGLFDLFPPLVYF